MLCSICDGLQNIFLSAKPYRAIKCPACHGSGTDDRRGPGTMIKGPPLPKAQIMIKMYRAAGMPVPEHLLALSSRNDRTKQRRMK
jgi:hypothetical protein